MVVIGPKQLPEVARTVGRFLNELRRSSDAIKDEFLKSTKSALDQHKTEESNSNNEAIVSTGAEQESKDMSKDHEKNS